MWNMRSVLSASLCIEYHDMPKVCESTLAAFLTSQLLYLVSLFRNGTKQKSSSFTERRTDDNESLYNPQSFLLGLSNSFSDDNLGLNSVNYSLNL